MNNWNQFKGKIFGTKDLASIGLGDVLGSGISAIFWFYMATVIEPKEYGEIHYFIGIASIASYLSLIATQNTIIVYVSKKFQIQSTFYFISLVAAAISSFIILIIFYRLDTSLLVLGYVINTLAIGELLGKKLYSNYFKYILTQKILTLVLGMGFYYAFDVDGIIYALVLSYVVFSIQVYKGFKDSRIDFTFLKPRLGFIINNYIMNVVGGSVSQIDKIIVAPLIGFAVLGNYSLAMQVIAVLMIFSNVMFKYLLSQYASGKKNQKISVFTVVFSVCIAVFGIVVLPLFIPLFFPKYIDSINAIQIMSISIIPSTITILYTSKLLAMEKSKFVLLGSFISLITITTGMIILGPLFQVVGVAVAYVLAVSAQTSSLFFANRIINKV